MIPLEVKLIWHCDPCLRLGSCFFVLFSKPDNGGNIFLRNIELQVITSQMTERVISCVKLKSFILPHNFFDCLNRELEFCTPCESSLDSVSVHDHLHLVTTPAPDRVDKDGGRNPTIRAEFFSTSSASRQPYIHLKGCLLYTSQLKIHFWDCFRNGYNFLLESVANGSG